MGLFGKKDTTDTAEVVVKKVAKPSFASVAHPVTHGIIKPRITEKAALQSEKNVYVFEIRKGTTKFEVRDAVKALYGVTPVKVNIVVQQPRHYMSRMRGRDVMEHGLRKAYVYLKKGDNIELV